MAMVEILWVIWSERNVRNIGDRKRLVSEFQKNICFQTSLWMWASKELLVLPLSTSLQDWSSAYLPVRRVVNIWANWIPTSSGVSKLNLHGSSSGNPGKMGIGGLFQDHRSEIIQVPFFEESQVWASYWSGNTCFTSGSQTWESDLG